MSLKRLAVNHYWLRRSFMNIRNCLLQVSLVRLLLNPVKSNDFLLVGRAVKIQIDSGLKLRIEGCRKSCASLKDKFCMRILLDTNNQVKVMNSMFLLAWQYTLPGLFAGDMGWRVKAIVDDQLGTFGFVFL